MSDELTISAAMRYSKGGRLFDSAVLPNLVGVQLDVTDTDFTGWKSQTILTSVAALSLGSITTPGYMLCKNISVTADNYITIRSGSGGAAVVRIRPQGIALFELETTTPYAIANSVSAELLYCIIER